MTQACNHTLENKADNREGGVRGVIHGPPPSHLGDKLNVFPERITSFFRELSIVEAQRLAKADRHSI